MGTTADNLIAYKRSQASLAANACGNGDEPFNILCQDPLTQIQGDGNAVNIIGLQKGGAETSARDGDGVGEPSASPGQLILDISLDCEGASCGDVEFEASANAVDPTEFSFQPSNS